MRSRTSQSLASPLLVGATTLLIVIVAVFLSYNANKGLPFVPTTELKVRLPNGANLVAGNDVRVGGQRVGFVKEMNPVMGATGKVEAEVVLKLDKTIGTIPAASRVRVRPRSALGLKFLELSEVRGGDPIPDGGTLARGQGSASRDLDDVFRAFDEPTRRGAQAQLKGFGDGLVGRGQGIGRAIDDLPRVLPPLERVMRNLADDQTRLPDFFNALARTVRAVRPVTDEQVKLFGDLATTFDAIDRSPESLQETISETPRTLRVGTPALRGQRPFLNDLADFSGNLRGVARELRLSLPEIDRALVAGTAVQRRAPRLSRDLDRTLQAARALAVAPSTNPALEILGGTVRSLNSQVRFLGPFQTVCNSATTFFTYLSEHLREPDATGGAQRALLNAAGPQPNGVGAAGAFAPANGGALEGADQHLHAQAYGAAIGPNGDADCEAGQRGYPKRLTNFPENFDIVTDPRTPGLQGTTYTGRPRVPKGQTFTAFPETGAYTKLPPSSLGDR